MLSLANKYPQWVFAVAAHPPPPRTPGGHFRLRVHEPQVLGGHAPSQRALRRAAGEPECGAPPLLDEAADVPEQRAAAPSSGSALAWPSGFHWRPQFRKTKTRQT